ncbi:centromere protein T isoform X2 [Crotalus tigris]|uniref:centromere protein T isoform X2 n=1 Tax=Crotalus tigris TaxID=88082 RepID=UPI00192F1CDD|nr:centromere protein T isoform X2 [Crotalus tigris]
METNPRPVSSPTFPGGLYPELHLPAARARQGGWSVLARVAGQRCLLESRRGRGLRRAPAGSCLSRNGLGGRAMASRWSLRKQPEREPQERRKSLRLASQKAVPFNHQRSVAYQAPTTSALMDFATPRTVFKKVLQTQPIVSPFVSEKPDSPKPIDTFFHFPEKTDSSISLEVSLSDLSQRQKSKITRHPTRSKKVRLSVFERGLNNQLHSSTDQGLLDHTSLTKSLQISFTTPAPLNSAGKKGLMRRPKHYRGVNVKDFEGGLEQGLLQIKDSENYPEDQKMTTLQSNNTEAQSVETEVFLPPHSSEENDTEPSNVPPEPDLARQSLGDGRAPSLSQTRLARQDETSDMEVEKVAESIPKEILAPGSERTVEAETECTEEKDDRSKRRCQESPEGAGKGLRLSLGKENLSPGSEDASSTESISQKRRVTPQRQQQKNFHGNSPDEEPSTHKQPLKIGLGARSSFSTWLSRKIARRSVNELVAHFTQELDNLLPGVAGRGLAKVDLEKGSSLREKTVEISQSPRVRTPNRRASGKTPRSLERMPFKDRTNPQTGGRNRTREMRNVDTEQILEFEAEDNPEVEEMSESEDIAIEISQSPRVVTPNRRASGKTPKSLDRTPFKEMRDRTNPQTGGRNRTKEMRNVETEQILEFEDEDNPEVEEMSESEDIAIEISQSPRVVTPNRRASGKTPKSLDRTQFKEMRDRTNPQTGGRNRTRVMRNVETEQILEFEDEDNPEVEEMSESEDIAIEISQSPRVVTPNRRASGKTPKSLDRTPFKEMRDRTNPQTGGRNKTKEKRNVETEQILEFEDEDNPEVEEMSESENIEPTGKTPAFVRAKAFHCTPLLSSPRVLKEAASGSPVRQDSVQRHPKPAKKACRRKREPSLPNNLVKKMFTHYVKMPVTKEALEVVERCVNVYFKHLSNDLDAYVTHARRKTADPADVELLMKRQGLITDKMPLHVLVERHLPFEYRKLLIPIATSGNKVIPQKLK